VVLLLGVIATAVLALRQAATLGPTAAGAVAAAQRADPAAAARSRPAGLRAGPVTVHSEGFLSWALLDRRTGRISGSPDLAAPGDTMSMVKAWLAADLLHRLDDRGEEPTHARLGQLSIMIRDSDNAAAEAVYALVGGRESVDRMIATCRLTDSRADPTRWSNTVISARDTVRLGQCIADGRAAGPRWTPWLLDEMRGVRGAGDFGVRAALPPGAAAGVAVKNGWLLRDEDGLWHVACLAVADRWVIGVLARYPARLGLGHGAGLCRDVGAQLLGLPIPVAAAVADR
jgi:beta-lactamase family protein